MNPALPLLVAVLATAVPIVEAQTGGAPTPAARPARDVRYLVLHLPGPAWDSAKSSFEQVGIQDHVEHYRRLNQQGKLEFGGPFMDAKAGGMMIPSAGLSEAEIRQFAADDPAVKTGLLVAEIRPWLVGMRRPAATAP